MAVYNAVKRGVLRQTGYVLRVLSGMLVFHDVVDEHEWLETGG